MRPRLADIVRQVKIESAEQGDVALDAREADRARLELLAEELRPVFEDVPQAVEQFDFALSSGLQPRLWIDAVAHVGMGRDRRHYRFVRDTRHGPIILADTVHLKEMATSVSRYIAERLIERERMLDGAVEPVVDQVANRETPSQHPVAVVDETDADAEITRNPRQSRSRMMLETVAWLLAGAAAGTAILVGLYWLSVGR